MLARAFDAVPASVAAWRDAGSLRGDLERALDEELAACEDRRRATELHARLGVGTPADYLQRVIEAGGARVLCGVWFLGGDAARPFVDLLAWTAAGLDPGDAAARAMEAFGVFDPRAARVFAWGDAAPAVPGAWRAGLDQVVCAAPVSRLLEGPEPASLGRVRLEDASVDDALAFMDGAYAAFRERDPALGARVPAADRDQLAACVETGRLAWWTIDGERGGLIGVARERAFGLDGFLMMEEIVAPEYAGRGSAAAAQRRVAEFLADAHPGAVLFGTIDGANAPSRRAAARAGRPEVGAWWFLTPPGSAGLRA